MAALAAALSTGQHTRTPEELSWDAEGTLNSAAWQPAPPAGHAPPGAAAGAPGRGKQPASRSGGAVLRQLQSSAGPQLSPRLQAAVPGGVGLGRDRPPRSTPGRAGVGSARPGARPLHKALLPGQGRGSWAPAWMGGGRESRSCCFPRAGVGGGRRGRGAPSHPGPGAPQTEPRRQPQAVPTAGRRAQRKHPSRRLRRVGLLCRSEDLGGALSTPGAGALGVGTRTHPAGARDS